MSAAIHTQGPAPAVPSLPESSIWMTKESKWRLADGGNCKGSVPVHAKKTSTSFLPLFTAEQMQAYGRECVASIGSCALEGSTSAAHTPGPWGVDAAHIYPSTNSIVGYYVSVTDLSQEGGFNGRVAEAFANCVTGTDDVAMANAKLIAAAPELLAALQAVVNDDADSGEGISVPVFRQVIAAIAKASGSAS